MLIDDKYTDIPTDSWLLGIESCRVESCGSSTLPPAVCPCFPSVYHGIAGFLFLCLSSLFSCSKNDHFPLLAWASAFVSGDARGTCTGHDFKPWEGVTLL